MPERAAAARQHHRHSRRRPARPHAGRGRRAGSASRPTSIPTRPARRPSTSPPPRPSAPMPMRTRSRASPSRRCRHLRVRERAGRDARSGSARGTGFPRRQIFRRRARPPRREGFRHRARHSRRPLCARSTRLADLRAALSRIAPPALLKTRRFGYDGKGQVLDPRRGRGGSRVRGHRPRAGRARRPGPVRARSLGDRRARAGRRACLLRPGRERASGRHPRHQPRAGPHRAWHRRSGPSRSPAKSPRRLVMWACSASRCSSATAESPALIVNEFAPRVHNSGHWTLDACLDRASSRTTSGRFAAGRSATPRATAMR